MPKGKKAVDYAEIISLLNKSQESTANLKAIAKQANIIEKAVAELKSLMKLLLKRSNLIQVSQEDVSLKLRVNQSSSSTDEALALTGEGFCIFILSKE
jgi:hypothetical protein